MAPRAANPFKNLACQEGGLTIMGVVSACTVAIHRAPLIFVTLAVFRSSPNRRASSRHQLSSDVWLVQYARDFRQQFACEIAERPDVARQPGTGFTMKM